MKIKRVTVKKNERGLLLRNGDFERVLQPGTHWLFAGIDTCAWNSSRSSSRRSRTAWPTT
jgi:hypothetical protein